MSVRCSMPSSMCSGQAASGRLFRRICRPAARSGSISTCGNGTARSAAFIMLFTSRRERWQGGRQARPQPSSTARPPKEPSKGATLDPSGYDPGKKVTGRKRHILTDTLGLLLAVTIHPASVQDRDGAEALLREARRTFPFIERVIGDAGYQGRKMEA